MTDTQYDIDVLRAIAGNFTCDPAGAAALRKAADRMEAQSQTITHLTADYEAVKSRLELLEAKLPVYKDTGRAFVPGVDECWSYIDHHATKTEPEWFGDHWRFRPAEEYGYELVYRAYSTAAACEEAEATPKEQQQ